MRSSVAVGSTFTDMFGLWTVVGEPEWTGEIYVQDVRDPDGMIARIAVPALAHCVDREVGT